MKNRSAIKLILLISVSICSCQPPEKSENNNTNKVLPYAERYTYLTDTAETKWLAEPFAKFWQPTDSQKKAIENLAIEHIATHIEPEHSKLRNEPFERYYRQYIAYVSQEGDSILNINAYLKEKAAADYPWIADVYEATSGFIHFSRKHIMNATTLSPDNDRSLVTFMGKTDNKVSVHSKLEAILAMIEISNCIARQVYGWIETKRIEG